MNPGVLIQVSLKSKRLPYKAFRLINGKPVLLRLIERLEPIRLCGIPIIVCTSTVSFDDPIEFFCKTHHLNWYRGEIDDLARRFWDCAEDYGINPIIRVTGDNPLVDPDKIIELLGAYNSGLYDYAYLETESKGIRSEVINPHILSSMPKEDQEHRFTEYLKKYRCISVKDKGEVVNWTIDTPEDLERVRHESQPIK